MAHKANASQLIDQFIADQPEFASQICTKLRQIIHQADPYIVEDWKWGPNFFDQGMVCGFGAFKGWVTFTFFQGDQMSDPKKLFNYGDSNAHNRSIKFTDVSEINEQVLVDYLKEAVQINKSGSASKLSNAGKKEIEIPVELEKILSANGLLDHFKKLAYTHRKEYIVWITDAKKEETKQRRLERAVEMLQAGKTI